MRFGRDIAVAAGLWIGVAGGAAAQGAADAGAPSAPMSEAEAAGINLRLAADLCIRNVRIPSDLTDAFTAAGFALTPGLDPGVFEARAPGVFAAFGGTGQWDGFCFAESDQVDLPTAQAIMTAILADFPPGAFERGWPGEASAAPPPLCEGYVAWDLRPILTVSFSAAGNSGECVDNGTAQIRFQ